MGFIAVGGRSNNSVDIIGIIYIDHIIFLRFSFSDESISFSLISFWISLRVRVHIYLINTAQWYGVATK